MRQARQVIVLRLRGSAARPGHPLEHLVLDLAEHLLDVLALLVEQYDHARLHLEPVCQEPAAGAFVVGAVEARHLLRGISSMFFYLRLIT